MNDCLVLFSDIHADIEALEALLAVVESPEFKERYGPVAKLISLGDALERGYYPAKVVRRLSGLKNLASVLGNHDEAFLNKLAVMGSDNDSDKVHEGYFKTGRKEYEPYFRDMQKTLADLDRGLFAVHGGPIEPGVIPAGDKLLDDPWIYSQTWQRISTESVSYVGFEGYCYLPAQAFDYVKTIFPSDGFVVACGHNHREAAYGQRAGVVEDLLGALEVAEITLNGRRVREIGLPLRGDTNYLVRLGIAGPEGYIQFGWDTCHFGVLAERGGARTFYLLAFEMGRKME